MEVKKSQSPPFTVFGIVRFSKGIIFVFKLGFLRPSTLYPIFVFFKAGVFSMRLFKIRFHRSPPHFLQETKRFGSVKDSSTFSALCDLPETFIKKFFPSFFCFLKEFPLRNMGFLLFPVGEEWFSRLMRIPSGIFGAVKLIKF